MDVKIVIEYVCTLYYEDEIDIKNGNLSLSDIDWSYYDDNYNTAYLVSVEEV